MHPNRQDDVIVEVVRDGEVVATIYGSREGIHVISRRFDSAMANVPFFFKADAAPIPGYVIPLLSETDECPWCDGKRLMNTDTDVEQCPVCTPVEKL